MNDARGYDINPGNLVVYAQAPNSYRPQLRQCLAEVVGFTAHKVLVVEAGHHSSDTRKVRPEHLMVVTEGGL